jgi:hypothetical protein
MDRKEPVSCMRLRKFVSITAVVIGLVAKKMDKEEGEKNVLNAHSFSQVPSLFDHVITKTTGLPLSGKSTNKCFLSLSDRLVLLQELFAQATLLILGERDATGLFFTRRRVVGATASCR